MNEREMCYQKYKVKYERCIYTHLACLRFLRQASRNNNHIYSPMTTTSTNNFVIFFVISEFICLNVKIRVHLPIVFSKNKKNIRISQYNVAEAITRTPLD